MNHINFRSSKVKNLIRSENFIIDHLTVLHMFCFHRVLIYGSHAILINLCKDKNGKIPFSSASVVLLSEVIKVRIYDRNKAI